VAIDNLRKEREGDEDHEDHVYACFSFSFSVFIIHVTLVVGCGKTLNVLVEEME